MADRVLGQRAIVVGAGMGGLAAAAALAGFFDSVVVVDRDDLPDAPVPRAGVPQGRHLHVLLASGLRALNELFPGIEQDFIAAGAVPMQAGLDLRHEAPGLHPFPQRDFGWTARSLSRPLLELIVRHALGRRSNVTIRPRSRVTELTATPDGATVTGVRLNAADGAEPVAADLVVDASGRAALTLGLLQAHGHPTPEESTVGIGMRYATAVFAIPADPPRGWKGVLTMADPPSIWRVGLLFPVEGGRWMVVVGGVHGDAPPADRDGFLAFAGTLATRTIFDAVRDAELLRPIERYGLPASVRRHFERIAFFPRGLLVAGDGLCLFNPVYGQGMSVAAQQAALLRRLLARLAAESADPLAELAPAFFAAAQPLTDAPWWNAAVPDLAHPATTGERPPGFEAMLQYGAALRRIAAEDAAVHKLILEVQHLLTPRSALSEPALAARVRAAMVPA